MAQKTTTVSVQPVQSLSAPSATLMYMDYTYGKAKSKKGRPSSMRRFKIKYTNTKGVIKTRNIKATSEERAMGEIIDMGQHHYTIVETLDEPDPEREHKNPCTEIQLPSGFTVTLKGPDLDEIQKLTDDLEKKKLMEKWSPIMDKVDPNMGAHKKEWLSKYAQQHQDAVITYDPYSLLPILPIAKRVIAKTITNYDYDGFSPEKDGGIDPDLTQEDWDAGNNYGSKQLGDTDSWNG
jgi:hypothetical protein